MTLPATSKVWTGLVWACLALVLTVATAFGQSNQIRVDVTVESPVPPYIERWRDLIAVQLEVNPSAPQDEYEIGMLFDVQHLEPGSSISASSASPTRPIMLRRDDGVYELTAGEIEDLTSPSTFNYTGFEPLSYNTRGTGQRVPGGCYEVNVFVQDQTGTTIGQSFPVSFGVMSAPPPRLLQPSATGRLAPTEGTPLVPAFQWQQDPIARSACLIGPIPELNYTIEMVEVPEGVAPQDALDSGGGFVYRTTVLDGSTIFEFVPDEHAEFPLTPGRTYAWRVVASDPSAEVFLENEGRSETHSFLYGAPGADEDMTVTVETEGPLIFDPANEVYPLRFVFDSEIGEDVTITDYQMEWFVGDTQFDVVATTGDEYRDVVVPALGRMVEMKDQRLTPGSQRAGLAALRDRGLVGPNEDARINVRYTFFARGQGSPYRNYTFVVPELVPLTILSVEGGLIATITQPDPMVYNTDNTYHPITYNFRNVGAESMQITGYEASWRVIGETADPGSMDVRETTWTYSLAPGAEMNTEGTGLTLPPHRQENILNRFPGRDRLDIEVDFAINGQSGGVPFTVFVAEPVRMAIDRTSPVLQVTLLNPAGAPATLADLTFMADQERIPMQLRYEVLSGGPVSIQSSSFNLFDAARNRIYNDDVTADAPFEVAPGAPVIRPTTVFVRTDLQNRVLGSTLDPVELQVEQVIRGTRAGGEVATTLRYPVQVSPSLATPLAVRYLTFPAEDPATREYLTYGPGLVRIAVVAELTNTGDSDITIERLDENLFYADGSEFYSRGEYTPETPIVVPAGGSPVTRTINLLVSEEAQNLARARASTGQTMVNFYGVADWFGRSASGNVIQANSGYDARVSVNALPTNLRVTVSSETGLPVLMPPGVNNRPVMYSFENLGAVPMRVTSVGQVIINPNTGEEVNRRDPQAAPDDWMVLQRTGDVGSVRVAETDLGWPSTGTPITASGETAEAYRFQVTFTAMDDLGRTHTATVPVPVRILPSVLAVSVNADGGMPVNIYPGHLSADVQYTFDNLSDDELEVVSIQQWVTAPGETGTPGPAVDRRPGPLTVPASGQATDNQMRFGTTEASQELRLAGNPSGEFTANVRFTARETANPSQTHTALVQFPLTYRESPLRIEAVAAEGGSWPLTLHPGIDRQALTYVYTNQSTDDLEVYRMTQRVTMEDGSQVSEPTDFTLPEAVAVAGGASVRDERFFGITRAGIDRILSESGGEDVMVLATITAYSRAPGSSAEGIRSTVTYQARLTNSTLLVTVIPEGGTPMQLYAGENSRQATYTFRNVGTEPITVTSLAQRWYDGTGAFNATGSPSTLSISVPAGGDPVVENRVVGTTPAFMSDVRASGSDRRITGELIFSGIQAGETVSAQVDLPTDVLVRSRLGDEDYVAVTPADGATVRGETPFSLRTGGDFNVEYMSSVRLQIFRVPPGVSTQDAILDADNRVLERNFTRPDVASSPTPNQVRFTDGVLHLLTTRGSDAAGDEGFTWTPEVGEAYVWTAGLSFFRTPDGAPGEDFRDMTAARFTNLDPATFVAHTPADGATVRGETSFSVAAWAGFDLTRVSVIRMEIFEVPDGVETSAAVADASNRVLERNFSRPTTEGSPTPSQLRYVEADHVVNLLEAAGSTVETDRAFNWTPPDPDKNYAWQATINFFRNADGATEASTMEMAPARFGARPAVAECGAECSLTAPTGAPDGGRAAESYVGNTLRIGAFDMLVTSATGTGSSLSGQGSIDVPYLRAPIAVEFTGIGVNNFAEVVRGEVKARTDRPDLIPTDWKDNVTELAETMSISESDAENVSEIVEAVEAAGRIVSAFTSATDPVSLPLGIDQHIDGEFLMLAIVGISFKPTGARLNAVLSVPLPETDAQVSIGARGICLTPAGFDEEFTFYLATDFYIALTDFDEGNEDYTMRFKAGTSDGTGTYMTWKCSTMEALRLEMWHEFPRDWLLPMNPTTGEIIADENVHSTAKLVVEIRPAPDPEDESSSEGSSGSSGDSGSSGSGSGDSSEGSSDEVTQATGLQWIAGVKEFTPSAIADANGFWFQVKSMFYDNSSVQNAPGMTFPAGYDASLKNNRWTGFYLGLVNLNLPDVVRSYGEKQNVQAAVENVLIDNTGLSMTFAARNLLTLRSDDGAEDTDCTATEGEDGTSTCTGNMAGWEFSVDEINLSILHNSFGTAGLEGQFRIPISEQPLEYQATLARPASLRDSDDGESTTSTSEAGTAAARAFKFECAEVLAEVEDSSSSGSSGGSSSSGEAPDLIFEMLIKPSEDIVGDVWAGDLTIARSSKICVGNQTGELHAGAQVNGRWGLKEGENKVLPAKITGLPFEKVRVMTFAPYFDAPNFARTSRPGGSSGGASGSGDDDATTGDRVSSSDSDSGSGFSVDISNIGLEVGIATGLPSGRTGVNVGLGFDIALKIAGDNVFRAEARDLVIWGRYNLASDDEPGDFEFLGPGGTSGPGSLPMFCVGGEAEVLKITGCIEVYNNRPGDGGALDSGVAGSIEAVIASQIGLSVAAEFGNRKMGGTEFDYFYVDAAAYITSGINIGGAVALYGILGGVWYNMEADIGFGEASGNDFGKVKALEGRAPSEEAARRKYRPVVAGGEGAWGFKAGIILGAAGNPETFNMDVYVQVQFGAGGNFHWLRFVGDAYVMTKLTDRSDPKIRGTLTVQITSHESGVNPDGTVDRDVSLDANFTLVGNLAGVLTINGNAGLHVGPDYWQFYIGKPDDKFRAELLGLVSFGAYIMAGERLPSFPPPPPGFSGTPLTDEEKDAVTDAANSTGVGEDGEPRMEARGFMMGANLRLEPELDLLIIGVSGYLNLGFDVAALQENIFCLNDPENPAAGNFQRGDNGWYVEGRMYAQAGLRLWTRALFGIKVTLARVDGGVMLEGGFPNPDYFAGEAYIRGEILGVIEFDGTVDFTVGEECEVSPKNPLSEIQMITEVRPDNTLPSDRPHVSPFVAPAAVYFLDVDTPFFLEDETGANRKFRIVHDGFDLQNTDTGERITCRDDSVFNRSTVACRPNRPGQISGGTLESESNYEVTVRAHAEEYSSAGWTVATTIEGEEIRQEMTTRFRTGCLPLEIDGWVSSTFPMNGQRFFLQDEAQQGYIKTTQNFNYVRQADDPCAATQAGAMDQALSDEYDLLLRITPLIPEGDPMTIPIQHYESGYSFLYDIPELEPETVYAGQLIRKKKVVYTARGVSTTETAVATAPASSSTPTMADFGGARSEAYQSEFMLPSGVLPDDSYGSGPLSMNNSGTYDLGGTADLGSYLDPDVVAGLQESVRRQADIFRIKTRTLDALITQAPDEDRLYHWVFRTSRYRTLEAKLRDADMGEPEQTRRSALIFIINKFDIPVRIEEPFDEIDIYGAEYALNRGSATGSARTIRQTVLSYQADVPLSRSNDPYIAYANRDIYPADTELKLFRERLRYRRNQYYTALEQGAQAGNLVNVKSLRALPPLPDDPEALANMIIQQRDREETPSGNSIGAPSIGASLGASYQSSYQGIFQQPSLAQYGIAPLTPAPDFTIEYNVGSYVSMDFMVVRMATMNALRRGEMQVCLSWGPMFLGRRDCRRWHTINTALLTQMSRHQLRDYMRSNYPIWAKYSPGVPFGDMEAGYTTTRTRPAFRQIFNY